MLGILAIVSVNAANHIGFLVGWLTGASQSPIAKAIAPTVFGLLAVLGVSVKLRYRPSMRKQKRPSWRDRHRNIWQGILVAVLVIAFCRGANDGFVPGIRSRAMPYKDVKELLGKSWETTDHETAITICAFSSQARLAGLPTDLYERFMWDVVRPILDQKDDDTSGMVRTAVQRMQAVLPKSGEQAKADPVKEPEPANAE